MTPPSKCLVPKGVQSKCNHGISWSKRCVDCEIEIQKENANSEGI
jgi:hypothetical protein